MLQKKAFVRRPIFSKHNTLKGTSVNNIPKNTNKDLHLAVGL